MPTYRFKVQGMHCPACVILTESELRALPDVKKVSASLKDKTVELSGDFGDTPAQQLAQKFSAVLKPHGYALLTENSAGLPKTKAREALIALPGALLFLAAFIGLQQAGVVNWISADKVSYGTAFLIGVVASVSTCMAVVGGLVLSLSANFAKSGDKVVPQVLFHAARLAAFFILGGLIGAVGAVFTLSPVAILLLGVLVALVLIILGLNLLDILPAASRWLPALPKSLGHKIHALRQLNHRAVPVLAGAATFFLPCGFTQSMQIYTLTTGNFWTGALTMLTFALGTLPVLALLSFGALTLKQSARLNIFYKAAGWVVIFFGILNLLNSLAGYGLIPPLLNF